MTPERAKEIVAEKRRMSLEEAVDYLLIISLQRTLDSFESPYDAVHNLCMWHQEVGEYFAKNSS